MSESECGVRTSLTVDTLNKQKNACLHTEEKVGPGQ